MCKDFGTISHLRCTYTCKDVGTISHLRCTNMCAYFFQLFFNSDLPSIYLIRSGLGGISSSILPRWDLFFHRSKARGQPKRWAQRTEINSNSRMCGGGVCRYGLLYQGTRHWFIWYVHLYILRVKTFVVYIIFTLHIFVRVYTFISSISSSILIFHRSISFDLVTVEFLLLSFHGDQIFSFIVAEKKDKWKDECKERRYSRAVGSAVGGACRYGLRYQGTRHRFI